MAQWLACWAPYPTRRPGRNRAARSKKRSVPSYYTSAQVDALLVDSQTGTAQDAETTSAISAALLAYYTSAQVDALLADYQTASAQDTQTQAAISGALLPYRTGPEGRFHDRLAADQHACPAKCRGGLQPGHTRRCTAPRGRGEAAGHRVFGCCRTTPTSSGMLPVTGPSNIFTCVFADAFSAAARAASAAATE